MQTLPYNIHSTFELVAARQQVIDAMSNQMAKLQYNLDYQTDENRVKVTVNANVFDIDDKLQTYFDAPEIMPIQRMALGKYQLGVDMSGNYIENFKHDDNHDDHQTDKHTIQYLGLFIKYLKPDVLPTSFKQALRKIEPQY